MCISILSSCFVNIFFWCCSKLLCFCPLHVFLSMAVFLFSPLVYFSFSERFSALPSLFLVVLWFSSGLWVFKILFHLNLLVGLLLVYSAKVKMVPCAVLGPLCCAVISFIIKNPPTTYLFLLVFNYKNWQLMLLQLSDYCSTTYWVCDLALGGPGQTTGKTH